MKISKDSVLAFAIILFYNLFCVLCVTLYVWTAIITYHKSGLLDAFLISCVPIIGQFYTGYDRWKSSGTIFNTYDIILIFLVLSFIIYGLISIFLEKESHK